MDYSPFAKEILCVSPFRQYSLVLIKTSNGNVILKLLSESRDEEPKFVGCITFGPDIFLDLIKGLHKSSDQIREQYRVPEVFDRLNPEIKEWVAGTVSIVEFVANGHSGADDKQPPVPERPAAAAAAGKRSHKKKKTSESVVATSKRLCIDESTIRE